MRVVSLSLLLSFLRSSSVPLVECFVLPKSATLAPGSHIAHPPNSNAVVLHMGLRDFLRRKKAGVFNIPRKELSQSTAAPFPPTLPPEPAELPKEPEPVVTAESTTPSIDVSAASVRNNSNNRPSMTTRSPMRMGEDPSTKQLNVDALKATESVQDKINRVKAGQMTQSEKEAFLDSVLSTGNSPESRKPLIKPKYEEERRTRQKASPFPRDSLLRNVARGKKSDSFLTSDILEKAQSDSQRKKQEYLNMVTDPNRFNSLSTGTGQSTGVTPQPGSASAARKTPISSASGLKPSTSKLMSKYFPASLPPKKEANPMPTDLGARLGRQAMEHERARQQAEEERREREWQEKEKVRMERQAMVEKQTEERQMAIEKQEAVVRERRQSDEESRMRGEQEKKEAEERRLQELMKAQEDYWKKQIKRNRGPSDIDEDEIMEDGEVDDVEGKEGSDDEDGEDTAKTEKPKKKAKAASPVSLQAGLSSLNDVGKQKVDDRDFLEDQARRKSEIEKAKDVQLEKLKALNSPLPPAPARFNEPAASPTGLRFDPQKRVTDTARSSSSSKDRGALGNLVQGQSTTYEPLGLAPNKPKPEPVADAAAEDREKTIEKLSVGVTETTKSKPPAASSAAGGMMGFFGRANEPAKPKKKKKPEPPVRKGPIRMALPLEDKKEEEEDEEDGVDVRSNQAMSIAEAMKRTSSGSKDQADRSKKWGIDMSKF